MIDIIVGCFRSLVHIKYHRYELIIFKNTIKEPPTLVFVILLSSEYRNPSSPYMPIQLSEIISIFYCH